MPALPFVSVIIPAFNAETFIERAIDSALAQEGIDLEVVVADDGSTDGTAGLIERRALAEPRIRLVRLPRNAGPSAARNAAIEAARGDWIAILDADDAFTAGRLRRLIDLAFAGDADIVADNFRRYDARTGICGPPALALQPKTETLTRYDFVERARAGRNEPDYGLLQPVIRRSFLDAHQLRYPERSRHGEDFLFLFHALLKGAVYVVTREPGYLYTSRSSGMSRTRVDYRRMAEESRALVGRPEIAQDSRLRRLILKRSSAIRWVHARHIVRVLLSEHRFGELLAEALKSPRVVLIVLRVGLTGCWGQLRQLVPRLQRKGDGENQPS
jgi:succinoglycan biosynthesis protein ExoO